MVKFKIKILWSTIAKVYLTAAVLIIFSLVMAGVYLFGMWQGYNLALSDTKEVSSIFRQISFLQPQTPSPRDEISTPPAPTALPKKEEPAPVEWGGPELWEAVNIRRAEFGVNALGQRDELCTVASLRLNELLELGKLDAHEGFTNLEERRPDLSWIFEKYGTIAEFLLYGAETPQEAVSLWENTLGHKKLLTGGEYVWGCIYSQNSFAVAITAF